MFAPPIAKITAKTTSATASTHARKTGHHISGRPANSLAERVSLLQRTIGNQATLRLLAQRSSRPFVGQIDDPLEHEADRIADQVMRRPAPEPSITAALAQLSRKCAAGEEDKLQKMPAGPQAGSGAPSIVNEVLRSPGQPLGAATREFFEPRFGHDFSQVQVHTNERAAATARALNARAYTIGTDIGFASGMYAPDTNDGRRLLAHELTHVVQQQGPTSTSTEQAPRGATKGSGSPGALVWRARPATSTLRSMVALQMERTPTVPTPETAYQDIGPLAIAWAKTQPAVEEARANLSRLVAELRAAPPEDQEAIFGRIVGAERALAAALRVHLDALAPPFHQLLEPLITQQIGEAGGGRFVGMRTMLQPYADAIERSRRELEILERVFAIETAQSIEQKYRVEVRPIPGGGCMIAMYKGFEVLFSPDDSTALRKQVYRDAQKVLTKAGRDTNNVDRVMETLRSQGRAGSARVSRYDRRLKAWVPTVESQVMDMIMPSIPGWFFFGLSISGAYHTVTLAVDTTGETPKVFWLDQFTRGFTKEVTGILDTKMHEKWLEPSYGYTISKVWPIIPDPASVVELAP